MRKSEIKFVVELDDKNVPEKILWDATDSPNGRPEETKAIALSLWDKEQKNTMRIDLWTKDMQVDEMKIFFIETIAGISQTLINSTGDEVMAAEIKGVVKKLIQHVEKEKAG